MAHRRCFLSNCHRRSNLLWRLCGIFIIYTVANLKVVPTFVVSSPDSSSLSSTRRQRTKDIPRTIRGGAGILDSSTLAPLESPSTADEGVIVVGSNIHKERMIRFLFSDVDGTLVHYTGSPSNVAQRDLDDEKGILHLPPSSTGMRGVISARTLFLCQKLRRDHGIKLALVSGMRTTTLLKRLPFLPRADAYASEAGGRIFYPVDIDDTYEGPVIRPQRYVGASDSDLAPFGLREDTNWRAVMEAADAAGKYGFMDDGMNSNDRKGALWSFARSLESKGFTIDCKGYSACFRVNQKQQNEEKGSAEEFEKLLKITLPVGLASSVNLGCVDFYPEASGKKNCCEYLAHKFTVMNSGHELGTTGSEVLSAAAVCMCDDDNDLEMALACHHAYVPGVTSASMAKAAEENAERITVTEKPEEGISGTAATEEAICLIIDALT